MTATITPQSPAEYESRRLAVVARARALGWSQNELARRIHRNPGTVSRALRGEFTSDPVWRRIEAVLLRAERRQSRKRVAA